MKAKPQWLLEKEAAKRAAMSEVKPEDKKEKVKDATDMFSRSKDFKLTQISTRSKEEIKKKKRSKTVNEEGRKSKRGRHSNEEEEKDAGAPARKTSLTPSKRSLSLRSSRSSSPQSLTKRYDAATSAAVEPKRATVVVSIDSDDDGDSLYTAPPLRPPVKKPEPKQKLQPSQDDESDIDPNEEFPELVRNARAKAKQQELEWQRRSLEIRRTDGFAEIPAVEEGRNPPIKIFIDPRIPDTQPLMVTRKWDQRFREVRNAWCERQPFVADFAKTVIFTWKGIRIFDVASCKTLGIKVNEDGEPFLPGKDGIDEDMSQIVLVATTQAIIEEEKEAAAEEEKRKEDESNGITAGPPAAPEKKKVKIMLSAKDYDTHKLIVQEDTTFERIANNFRMVRKIPDDKQITLMWDGEPLEPDDAVRDTEIEDMESIEVHIK